MESRIYEHIEAKLKERWLDRENVEKDVALKAAGYLSDWIKLAGIPFTACVVMFIATLSYFGIKSTSDLATAEKQAASLKETAKSLESEYKPLQDEIPKLQMIVTRVTDLQTRVATIETEVAHFATSSRLKPEVEKELRTTLTRYSSYLINLGLKPPIVPTVHVEDDISTKWGCYHACAVEGEIYLLSGYENSALVVHEFTHTVINRASGFPDEQWQYSAIEAGIANYLTSDFLGSPRIDETNLNEGFPIDRIPPTWSGGQTQGGLAWGSYLWKLRAQAGTNKIAVTKAIVQAWTSIRTTSPPRDYRAEFLQALVSAGLDASMVNRTLASASM